jgi:hypothetical protein
MLIRHKKQRFRFANLHLATAPTFQNGFSRMKSVFLLTDRKILAHTALKMLNWTESSVKVKVAESWFWVQFAQMCW